MNRVAEQLLEVIEEQRRELVLLDDIKDRMYYKGRLDALEAVYKGISDMVLPIRADAIKEGYLRDYENGNLSGLSLSLEIVKQVMKKE